MKKRPLKRRKLKTTLGRKSEKEKAAIAQGTPLKLFKGK